METEHIAVDNCFALTTKDSLALRVGGLLYAPATHKRIIQHLLLQKYNGLTSVAFCLEDAIQDSALAFAEAELCITIAQINATMSELCLDRDQLPLIFIRVRSPEHMQSIYDRLIDENRIVTGFILPKFDLSNAEEYADAIFSINTARLENPIYIMPILESKSISYQETRLSTLMRLQRQIDQMEEYVLNVRVGGNDFSNLFGLRRSVHQTIYDMGVVSSALYDILNIFSRDHIVSGPVWEYFENGASDDWKKGLERELALDRLNGFVGKTAIHPSQLPVIWKSMMVKKSDYEDALQILNWSASDLAVSRSGNGQRMNEVKVHKRWAGRIVRLADVYGIADA